MRERNWREYNKQLVQRGSLTFLVDPKTVKSLRCKRARGKLGRPLEFSDPLILLLLMVKVHFRLPYRTLEGFSDWIVRTLREHFEIPCYSLICKRAKGLRSQLPKLSHRRPETVILDSSGIKICGEGEWKVKIHGRGRPRKWLKVHIAIDARTQEVVAEVTTESSCADSTMTKPLLEQAGRSVKEVLADGAYDGSKTRKTIQEHGAKASIPPPKNARYRGTDSERDRAIAEIRGLGGDPTARSLWKKLSGHGRRSLVESTFSQFKGLFGDRLFSKTIERQKVEIRLRCLLINRMQRMAA